MDKTLNRSGRGVGYRLMRARLEAKLSRKALAGVSGVSCHTICKIEVGKIARPKCLDALAQSLGTTSSWLQFGQSGSQEFIELDATLRNNLKRILSQPEGRALLECLLKCLDKAGHKHG